jgi:hypothetical protein
LYQNELLAQAANAACAAFAAFILLMLLGTQILNWQFALLIPIAALVAGFFLARRRVPSPYRVAQIVDQRLSLADTLSTAFFFSQCKPAGEPSEIREFQMKTAERAAASADPKVAIPYTMPRGIYAMAALAVVAVSMFGLRYGLTRRLDLQQPLARLLHQTFGHPERTEQAKNTPKSQKPDPGSYDENQGAQQQEDQQQQQSQSEAENGADQNSDLEAMKPEDAKNSESAKKDAESGDPIDEGDQGGPGEEQAGNSDNSKSGQGEGKSDPKQDSASKDANNASSDNSGLMNKLKDFAQNLLSKVKPPNQGQQSGEQKGQQSKSQQPGAKQQAGKQGQKQDGQAGEPQEGESGDQAENSQDPEGKGQGQTDSKQSSKQPGSGMGSQDGEKKIRQAEQLAAMGKISEIIGKRAATVTGEATIEVKSTSQQIRTPYAQRGVQHSQGGAEINRDEVPVALQAYVEHYFENVRKQAPAKK